ncbi:hypothetical protein KXD40_007670 [Peronospora effusa]|uniref:WRKY19-like zinc finger domain-containing protein n=1 Tax=Peronospora effusa TaxID=542832 RepID=A0A3M6V779_9STRA|nr:hypothetical protein DD238_007514 [Peronospora effusa]UIZ23436.1 hypothetical protein KXD40_007670 [Peronospora effusa]CAI5707383.1 unnamed protein product [Peronospora effusa]
MMHTSAPHYTPSHYNLPSSQTETISISIGLGNDRSSSIVLPRGHDLVKHLERLIPTMPQPQTQQLMYTHQPEGEDATVAAARFDAVRALSSLPYQQSPQYQTQAPTSTWSQYMHPNSHLDTSTVQVPSPSTSLTSSPLYHSDQSSTGSARVYHHTQKHLKSGREPNISRPRYRRNSNSGSSKRCQVVNCDKISVSRGLCRGHGGGRRCQYVGCCKGAQSRSDLCWAHGGGQRCHVKGCLRSRKSKLYCVAHVDWDSSVSAPPAPTYPQDETLHSGMQLSLPKIVSPARSSALTNSPRLPSLLQALSTHTRSNFTVPQ